MFRLNSAAAAAALCMLISTVATSGEPPAKLPAMSWIVIPSGVADPDSQSVYVTGPSESLLALDLATGEQRWESKEAQLPLAVAGDRVIARTAQNKLPPNAMQLVFLDAATSKVLMHCQQIVFPEWVAVGGGLGLSFEAVASTEDNILTLRWHAARELAVAQGKATPEMIASAKKTTTGTVHVDLETGENKVTVDPAPRKVTLNRKLAFYDVGDKRLNVTQRNEKIEGGVQLVHRMLEARDQKTGKPIWRQPIVGEVYLPVGPSAEVSRRPSNRYPARR
ncbi:MAG: PQQ-binding-like beta-propeller repeat protein [Pirellulales bacterium]|nr:PQQ-binding-like beta-propeller repeat protein [Pirellulales bacterium]